MLFKKKKKKNLYSQFLNIFAAAMPFLHVPEELKVSRVQLHLLSLQAAASTCLCAGSGSGASWAPPASPPRCLEQQLESSRTGAGTCTWVVFCQSLGLCPASAAGWASSTVREWGWDKLFLRSPLQCSSSFLTSPRARSLLPEVPLVFLTLLPIRWLSS